MNNSILDQLNELKQLLTEKTERPLNFNEAAEYLDISKSYLYKLSSNKEIRHHKPNGKKLYFLKSDLDKWLLRNPVKSNEEIEDVALNYLSRGAAL